MYRDPLYPGFFTNKLDNRKDNLKETNKITHNRPLTLTGLKRDN